MRVQLQPNLKVNFHSQAQLVQQQLINCSWELRAILLQEFTIHTLLY
jgi:hypothetical protein